MAARKQRSSGRCCFRCYEEWWPRRSHAVPQRATTVDAWSLPMTAAAATRSPSVRAGDPLPPVPTKGGLPTTATVPYDGLASGFAAWAACLEGGHHYWRRDSLCCLLGFRRRWRPHHAIRRGHTRRRMFRDDSDHSKGSVAEETATVATRPTRTAAPRFRRRGGNTATTARPQYPSRFGPCDQCPSGRQTDSEVGAASSRVGVTMNERCLLTADRGRGEGRSKKTATNRARPIDLERKEGKSDEKRISRKRNADARKNSTEALSFRRMYARHHRVEAMTWTFATRGKKGVHIASPHGRGSQKLNVF